MDPTCPISAGDFFCSVVPIQRYSPFAAVRNQRCWGRSHVSQDIVLSEKHSKTHSIELLGADGNYLHALQSHGKKQGFLQELEILYSRICYSSL